MQWPFNYFVNILGCKVILIQKNNFQYTPSAIIFIYNVPIKVFYFKIGKKEQIVITKLFFCEKPFIFILLVIKFSRNQFVAKIRWTN